MQYELPADHGMSQTIRENKKLVFFEESGSRVALTDIQHAALENGVARGVSLLVVAPTSTGKTQIGLWALLAGLERRMSAVYLVTHRALARQKFEDFAELLIGSDLEHLTKPPEQAPNQTLARLWTNAQPDILKGYGQAAFTR